MGFKVEAINETEAWKATSILGPGWHTVEITEAKAGESTGGYDQVEMEMWATDGTGSVRDWLTVTEKTLGKVKALLVAAHIELTGEMEFPSDETVAPLVGKKLRILVVEEQDRDDPSKTRTRVKGYEAIDNAGGSGGDEDLPF